MELRLSGLNPVLKGVDNEATRKISRGFSAFERLKDSLP